MDDIRNIEYFWKITYDAETEKETFAAARTLELLFKEDYLVFSDLAMTQVIGIRTSYRLHVCHFKTVRKFLLYLTDKSLQAYLDEQIHLLLPAAEKIKNPIYKQWFTLED